MHYVVLVSMGGTEGGREGGGGSFLMVVELEGIKGRGGGRREAVERRRRRKRWRRRRRKWGRRRRRRRRREGRTCASIPVVFIAPPVGAHIFAPSLSLSLPPYFLVPLLPHPPGAFPS